MFVELCCDDVSFALIFNLKENKGLMGVVGKEG
jgi:hypothetical protein